MIYIFHGPVMSGKSKCLLDILAGYAADEYQAVKPAMESRDQAGFITSRSSDHRVQCLQIGARDLWEWMASDRPKPKVLAIDEAHMYGAALFHIVKRAQRIFEDVFISGLDRDWMGQFFPGMRELVVDMATDGGAIIRQMNARCSVCGCPAIYSQKVGGDPDKTHEPGHHYEPRCHKHINLGQIIRPLIGGGYNA